MKRYKIDPTIDLIDFIVNILLKERSSPANCLIIFPGKRPAHFLRKQLAEKIDAHQGPIIYSIDQFIENICALLGFKNRPINALDAVPELFRINAQAKLINTGERMTIDEFLPWGFKLFSDFEELMIEDIDSQVLQRIEKVATGTLPSKISAQMIDLSLLYKSFYRTLKEKHLSTRALRYAHAARNIEHCDLAGYDFIILAGFFAATASEKKIFRSLDRRLNTIFIFQKGVGIEEKLKDIEFECEDIEGPASKSDICFYQASDVHGEVFGLNKILEKGKSFDSRDVIVVPLADTLFPIVHHSVGYSEEHNVSIGYPLNRTPVAVLIELLSTLIQSYHEGMYELLPYLRYVLHPYIKNTFFKRTSLATRIIFHTIEKELSGIVKRSLALSAIEKDEIILEQCMLKLQGMVPEPVNKEDISKHLCWIHDHLIRPFEKTADIEDFANKLQGIFFFISEHSTVNQHAYTAPFIETVLAALDDIRTSGMKHERFDDIAIYFRFCLNYFRTIRHPFVGTPVRGLQVLGLFETRNIMFERVYFLDANEGIIPRSNKEDTILPHVVRKYLGLPTHVDREALSKYYFNVLITGAKEVHILYVQGNDRERSRYVEELIWQQEQAQGNIGVEAEKIHFDLKFYQNAPVKIKKDRALMDIIFSNRSFSPSRLDVYLKCPLQFYYRYLLQLEEKAEITDELESDRRGLLVHEILMRFFSSKIGKRFSLNEHDYQRIAEISEAVCEEYLPDTNNGLSYMIRFQILNRMREVLDYHRGSKFSDLMIIECENIQKPGMDSKPTMLPTLELNTHRGRARLRGRIDRIEERNSEYHIVDYKTGGKAFIPNIDKFDINQRSDWFQTLRSVQFPCYYMLFHDRYRDVLPEKINCSIMLLGGRAVEEKFLFKPGSAVMDRAGIYDRLTQAVIRLIEEINDPDIDLEPTSQPDENCPECPYQTICGQQWISRKY